jgi:hypothetical protein
MEGEGEGDNGQPFLNRGRETVKREFYRAFRIDQRPSDLFSSFDASRRSIRPWVPPLSRPEHTSTTLEEDRVAPLRPVEGPTTPEQRSGGLRCCLVR